MKLKTMKFPCFGIKKNPNFTDNYTPTPRRGRGVYCYLTSWYQRSTLVIGVELLLFANSPIFQLYHGET
jgi:hypothetical protein